MSLTINDLLQLNGDDFNFACIKVNMTPNIGGNNPLKEYFDDPNYFNNDWLFYKNGVDKFYGVGSLAICLVRCEFIYNGVYKGDKDTWLLTTIKRITEDLPVNKTTGYKGYELNDFRKNYFGRLIIEYHNPERLLIKKFSDNHGEFKIKQLLPRDAKNISSASSIDDQISDFLNYLDL